MAPTYYEQISRSEFSCHASQLRYASFSCACILVLTDAHSKRRAHVLQALQLVQLALANTKDK